MISDEKIQKEMKRIERLLKFSGTEDGSSKKGFTNDDYQYLHGAAATLKWVLDDKRESPVDLQNKIWKEGSVP